MIRHSLIGISFRLRIADLPPCGRRERETVGGKLPTVLYVRVSSSYHGKVVLKITAVLLKTVRLFILHKSCDNAENTYMKKYTELIYGGICGFLNGLFGSGGGTVAVPAFEKNNVEPRKAHASSVALIFILSLVTAVVYLINGKLDFGTSLEYIPYGLIGAVLGALLLRKMPDRIIRIVFGILIIASAVRMLI